MLEIHPLDYIFAIFSDAPGRGLEFEGTAFLVGDGKSFITARHLLPDAGTLVAARITGPRGNFMQIASETLQFDDDHDLLLGRLDEHPAHPGLGVTADLPASSIDLLTTEFSRTQALRDRDPAEMRLSPVTRKGHIIQLAENTLFTRRPTQVMELSFPALSGASGAPVINPATWNVVGMIVGNVDHQLIPAQVERVEFPKGQPKETIRYVMPGAVAVCGRYILDFIESLET